MLVEDYKPIADPDKLAGDYPDLPLDPMNERLVVLLASCLSFLLTCPPETPSITGTCQSIAGISESLFITSGTFTMRTELTPTEVS